MHTLKRVFVLATLSVLIRAGNELFAAEEQSQWCVQLHWGTVAPIGTLKEWFAPSQRFGGIQVGRWDASGWSWRVGMELLELPKENTSRLYYRDLDLYFRSVSATVRASHALASWPRLQVFAGGGVGLHHWRATRGAYQLAEVFVPAREQDQWSWAFESGMGARMALGGRFGILVEIGYRLIVGELWPALALRLENVSGLQSLFCTFGVQTAF
ncbi:MAG: hypothetical protein ONB30_09000 [candidate division KSB1 bacterium]|nr:hypothetical protein [candidate division KSB1 bacterium]